MFNRGHGCGFGERGHGERGGRNPQILGQLRVGDGVTHAQPGEPLCFGEGAQHDHVRVVVEQVQPVHGGVLPGGHGGCGAEFVVCLINDDHHVLGDFGEKFAHLCLGDGWPGGVIRGAHQDHTGSVGNSLRHGVQIVRPIGQVGDLHAFGAQQPHQNGVGFEGPPGVDHFVLGAVEAGPGEGFEDLVECSQASRAGHNIVGVHPQAVGEGGTQPGGERIRVAVGGVEFGENARHLRYGPVRVFVGGELVLFQPLYGCGRFTGSIFGQRREDVARLDSGCFGGVAVFAHSLSIVPHITAVVWGCPPGRSQYWFCSRPDGMPVLGCRPCQLGGCRILEEDRPAIVYVRVVRQVGYFPAVGGGVIGHVRGPLGRFFPLGCL